MHSNLSQGKGNVTPLHTAAVKGYTNCVRMLLEADARIRLEDALGCDAFAKAERSKRREAVLRLLRSKGKVNIFSQSPILPTIVFTLHLLYH